MPRGLLPLHSSDQLYIYQSCEPSGNLCLTHPSRSYHYYIFWGYFFPEFRRKLLSPPAVSQCNGNRPLGILLTNYIFIKFSNYPPWSKLCIFVQYFFYWFFFYLFSQHFHQHRLNPICVIFSYNLCNPPF